MRGSAVERVDRAAVTFGAALVLALGASGATPALAQGHGAADPLIERALESRSKGDDDADVVVFEIADFQCPYCATFAETVAPELDERYVQPGRVQWVFVNLPLHTHPLAWIAAEAALCAGAAGGEFWAMHDRLFAEQETWGAASDPGARFARMAADLGVPAEPYARCVAEDQVAPLIVQDLGSAISAGISGTPTFIVMRGQEVIDQLVGVQSVEEWAKVLDPLLEE